MGWSNEWAKPEPLALGNEILLEIPIKGGWGKNATKAIQVGDLAVHEALGWNEEYNWQVTHVPTLTMFDRAIPDGNWSREQLIKWCWKVQQSLHMQWDNFRRFSNTDYNNIAEEDKKQMIEHCLSIGVE